jgi:hypothetical protein
MSQRSPDVANVFWDPAETLRCLQCSSPIQPSDFSDGTSTFLVWFTSNEDAGVYCREVAKDVMPRFTFYKFCSEDCCRQFTLRFGAATDHAAVAKGAMLKARELHPSRFVLGGLFIGMPIEEAISVINFATGRNYRTRRHGDCVVFSKTSNIDYPCNPVVLRSHPAEHSPLAELRLDEEILALVLQAYDPTLKIENGPISHLRERMPLFSLNGNQFNSKSHWMVGYPEKGVRLYICSHEASDQLASPPLGSIVLIDLKRSKM